MAMNIVAIIQARMGSTRLPGKALIDVAGESMLARVVERTQSASSLNKTVVAFPDRVADDVLIAECGRLSVPYFRGSETDVLDRFLGAATAYDADAVVRITADCPLIDAGVIDDAVRLFRDTQPDYASNTVKRTYPRGLDVEVIALSALVLSAREATEAFEREHVTPYIYRHPGRFHIRQVTTDKDFSDLRWTVDTPEDLKFVREIYRRLPRPVYARWRDVLKLLDAEPSLAALNQGIRQKPLEQG